MCHQCKCSCSPPLIEGLPDKLTLVNTVDEANEYLVKAREIIARERELAQSEKAALEDAVHELRQEADYYYTNAMAFETAAEEVIMEVIYFLALVTGEDEEWLQERYYLEIDKLRDQFIHEYRRAED
jgi:hypothetical protein